MRVNSTSNIARVRSEWVPYSLDRHRKAHDVKLEVAAGFYRATAWNAMHGIATTILSLSVRPSVRRVYCDRINWWTAVILIPHEMAITLVLWHQHWLVGDAPSLQNISQNDPPRAKLIVPCNQYFMCIWQMALWSRYSCLMNSYSVSPYTEPLAVLTTAQWTFRTWAVARPVSHTWATCKTGEQMMSSVQMPGWKMVHKKKE